MCDLLCSVLSARGPEPGNTGLRSTPTVMQGLVKALRGSAVGESLTALLNPHSDWTYRWGHLGAEWLANIVKEAPEPKQGEGNSTRVWSGTCTESQNAYSTRDVAIHTGFVCLFLPWTHQYSFWLLRNQGTGPILDAFPGVVLSTGKQGTLTPCERVAVTRIHREEMWWRRAFLSPRSTGVSDREVQTRWYPRTCTLCIHMDKRVPGRHLMKAFMKPNKVVEGLGFIYWVQLNKPPSPGKGDSSEGGFKWHMCI